MVLQNRIAGWKRFGADIFARNDDAHVLGP